MLHSLLLPFALLGAASALTCMVTNEVGEIVSVTNSTWTYCVLIPASNGEPGSAFGLGPADQTEDVRPYDRMFAQNSPAYQVLTTCILERYDFNSLRVRFRMPVEFMFRCVCNYNECNRHTAFGAFLKGLRTDNP